MTQKRRKMIDVLSSEPHSRVLSTQPHECIVHKHCWRPVEADRGRKMPAVSFTACYQGIQIPLYNKVLYYYYLPRASTYFSVVCLVKMVQFRYQWSLQDSSSFLQKFKIDTSHHVRGWIDAPTHATHPHTHVDLSLCVCEQIRDG